MANHASAEKRYRQSERRRLHNKYYAKTTRNALRAIRNTNDKAAAEANAPKVYAIPWQWQAARAGCKQTREG